MGGNVEAFKQDRRRGCGYRDRTMGSPDPPRAERYRPVVHTLDSELLETFNTAHDVHESVNSAHLV
jgi:hypothetical protein